MIKNHKCDNSKPQVECYTHQEWWAVKVKKTTAFYSETHKREFKELKDAYEFIDCVNNDMYMTVTKVKIKRKMRRVV